MRTFSTLAGHWEEGLLLSPLPISIFLLLLFFLPFLFFFFQLYLLAILLSFPSTIFFSPISCLLLNFPISTLSNLFLLLYFSIAIPIGVGGGAGPVQYPASSRAIGVATMGC